MEQVEQLARRYSNTDVYATAQRFENSVPTDGEPQYCGLYFDFDDDTGGKEAKKDVEKLLDFLFHHLGLQKHEVRLYFTGNRGFHIIVLPETLGVQPQMRL